MRVKIALMTALAWGVATTLSAEDWLTYMHDPARSGVSGEALALPLAELWAYVPPAEPTRAWPDPQPGWGELPKLDFDDATHVALAGDAVYFGSSVDNGVHALDAATGARRWTFFTEGPVRLAPTFAPATGSTSLTPGPLGASTVAKAMGDKTEGKPTFADGRVYAGSDDGFVYCLDARTGTRIWSARPIPGMTRILGAGRMMSLWPVRTGVLVDGGVAYCGAGLFPARGTAVVALDAQDGKLVWNATQVLKKAKVILAPNGYLLASADQVYVPNGRTVPLAYARPDGALRGSMENAYDIVAGKGLVSGDYGVLVGDLFYVGTQNVLHGYKPDGKHVEYWSGTRQLVATSNRYVRLTGPDPLRAGRGGAVQANGVSAIDRVAYDAAGRKRPVPKAVLQWIYAKSNLQAIVVAGPHVLVGGENEVVALDAATGKEVWKAHVEGRVKGLAVANGRLVVSTDKGRLHCFGNGTPAAIAAKPTADPFPADAAMARAAALAEAIAKDVGVQRGYGLVIGGDSARVAYALAKRTGLLVHVAESDLVKAAKAREALSTVGAYGTKVIVDVMPPDGTNGWPYPPYFANLAVVDGLSASEVTAREVLRVLKPCGGVLYEGSLEGEDEPSRLAAGWAAAGTITDVKLAGEGNWTKLVRGRLPGARDWTHQYADAGNTGSSDDERVRGKPEVLWYGEPGPDKMQERHRRSEAPLSLDGRMFVQGLRALENAPLLLSFDAYNGVPYWERELPGAERIYITGDCGNLAVSSQGLFVAIGKQCQRLDLLTGETRATYAVPARTNGSGGKWAYVAVEGDTLIGSSSSGYQFSDAVFAYDLGTDKLKWSYEGDVIRNSTLALQGGQASPERYAQASKVLFVEHRGEAKAPVVLDPPASARAAQARKIAAEAKKAKEEQEDGEGHGDAVEEPPAPVKSEVKPYLRTVVALDLATGKPVWEREVNLAGCGRWESSLCLIAKHDMVLLCGIYSAYGRVRGDEDKRRAMALSAKDGAPLWNEAIGNRVRPVIPGERIIGRPQAFDLRTGVVVKHQDGSRPWSIDPGGACGQMSASAGMLFYRHGQTMMMDVGTGKALMAFLGMRPGCLINIVPAGGVIVQVEGSSGCMCYHALQATVAFVPPGAE
ncbi:MAG: PQQ-binding-like beta-propeller repeat protein [Lentisphaerae bacterium]|nr:PQQ-binding-like beta-propeller repeat protein [Lentisphaerota bacterium]